jgi:hypothetical protein
LPGAIAGAGLRLRQGLERKARRKARIGAFRGLAAESPVFLPGLAGKKRRPLVIKIFKKIEKFTFLVQAKLFFWCN